MLPVFPLKLRQRIQPFWLGFALHRMDDLSVRFFAFPPIPRKVCMLPSTLRNSQNFLHSARLVNDLLDLTSITTRDTVLEIGPGKGQITAPLAARCKRVVAVEKDRRLYDLLKARFAAQQHVTIHHGDFLAYPLPRARYQVFASIPFDQTAAILQKLTGAVNPPQAAYLVMQNEAAGRFLGRPVETLRSILLKPWFTMRVLHNFQRGDFTPRPSVDALLLAIYRREVPLVDEPQRRLFRDFVTCAFTARQPDLPAALKRIFQGGQWRALRQLVPPGTLPSQVTLETWLKLFQVFRASAGEGAVFRVLGSERRLVKLQSKLEKIHRTRR